MPSEQTHVLLSSLAGLNVEATLFGGQAFRWRRDGERAALGWIGSRFVRVENRPEGLAVDALSNGDGDLADEAARYFDAGRDYEAVRRRLARDAPLRRALSGVSGVRVLRQPAFETLVSFVVSSNNNIVRIARSVEALCRMAGAPVETSVGTVWRFPEPAALAAIAPERLRAEANLGYRDRFVAETSSLVASGAVDLGAAESLETARLREALVALPGVGPKVADCVALFGFGRVDAFPVDTWVRKAMAELYLPAGERTSDARIAALGRERFGVEAGIAQQYLFEAFRLRAGRARK